MEEQYNYDLDTALIVLKQAEEKATQQYGVVSRSKEISSIDKAYALGNLDGLKEARKIIEKIKFDLGL